MSEDGRTKVKWGGLGFLAGCLVTAAVPLIQSVVTGIIIVAVVGVVSYFILGDNMDTIVERVKGADLGGLSRWANGVMGDMVDNAMSDPLDEADPDRDPGVKVD